MTPADYRVPMTAAAFDALTPYEGHVFDHYYEPLIDANHKIDHTFFEDAGRARELTRGQQLLLRLGTFDGQVCNGGITQFFWNNAEWLFEVADDIAFLGEAGLLRHYERALESLVGKKDRWLALRNEWAQGKSQTNWETFRASYDLLDLGWFDKAYFDRHSYNWRRQWVLKRRGLGHALMTRLAEYVRSHPDEFITGHARDTTNTQPAG